VAHASRLRLDRRVMLPLARATASDRQGIVRIGPRGTFTLHLESAE